MSYFRDVVNWHRAVGHPVEPKVLDLRESLSKEQDKSMDLGVELVVEELHEMFKGLSEQDIEETADGMADAIWVICGLAARMGINLDEVWGEVRHSNFKKLDGPVREDGKILKPEGWQPPNIKVALKFPIE